MKKHLIKFLSRAAECFAGECGHSPAASRQIGKQVASHLKTLPEIPNPKKS